MRVLVLSTVFPNAKQPAFGVFVRERMRRVARHCDVRVVAPIPWFPLNRLIRGARWSGIAPLEWQDGLPVHHPRVLSVPRYGKWLDGALYAASLWPVLARLRRELPFDLIDAHFAYPDGLAAVLLGRAFGCPVTITLRGSIVRLATYPAHRPQLRFALRRAARVFAVSDSLKRVAVGLGIPPGHIRVLPNGVDAERFAPRDRRECRAALGLPQEATILLSVGGLNEGKGHHRIVAALPELVRRHPGLLYVVVGGEHPGDSARARIERDVAEHGLEGRVRLVGERPHDEVPKWLAAADLFCLATRSEGWANVLLEALACGIPVVTTRVGGNAEIVTHEGLGLLVDPGSDEALRAGILAALARQWNPAVLTAHARAHSWDTTALEVVAELRAVVEGGPVPAHLAPAAGGGRVGRRG